MEIIPTESCTQFTSKEFQEGLYVRVQKLLLAAPHHQEIYVQVKVICQTLKTIAHSITVHARVSEEYLHFALM